MKTKSTIIFEKIDKFMNEHLYKKDGKDDLIRIIPFEWEQLKELLNHEIELS